MCRICCCAMIPLRWTTSAASSTDESACLGPCCAVAGTASAIAAISAAAISFIKTSFLAPFLAYRRKRFAAGFRVRLLAGLVERRAGFCRGERCIDGLDPVRHHARLLVVDQYRIDALDTPVGHQKTL